MVRGEIRLRALDRETLTLETPNAAGGVDVIRAEPAKVRRLYEGLAEALPEIYAKFEDPAPGEMAAAVPYATPVTALTERVPAEILAGLRDVLGRARGEAPPIILIAERDPFPWELVRPDQGPRMLGELVDMARFDGVCTGSTVTAWGILVIAPVPKHGSSLCDVAGGIFTSQHETVSKHFAPDRRVLLDCRSATQTETLRQLADGAERVIHYMGHHFHDKVDPGRSVLQLAGDESLTPLEVAGLGGSPTGLKWPWVFLNCCKGLANRQLGDPFEAGSPQWGPVLRAAGAWATVGPYWRVEKAESFRPAALLSQLVLEEGSSLGAAMRMIRTQPRRSPTMLAYTLVGDPTTKVSLG